ncbi:MAG: hypothetical protein ABR927_18965 [Bacteroidales bacterium]|jgi:hypothetical protein
MRRIILLLSLAFSLDAFSQIEKPITKGNMILVGGGTILFNKVQSTYGTNTSNTSIFTISLSPGFGYFIVNNLAIGLNTSISYYKQSSTKYYGLGAGPTIRYYFNNGLFIKAETSFSFIHGLDSNSSRQKSYSLVPGVGYAFFINQKVAFEPCLSYIYFHNNYSSDFTDRVNNIELELNFSIFL